MTFRFKTLLFACLTGISGIGIVAAQNLVPYCPQANGPIHAVAVSGDTVFVGGEFSKLYSQNYQSNYGTVLSTPANIILPQWAKPNGPVYATVPDGHKGYYIGGSFNMVGGEARSGLAHIDSMGEVTERFSDIATDNTVRALTISHDTLYAGGDFTRVGMFTETYGAIMGYDEKLQAVSKYINGMVYCAIPDGNDGWFIGGTFTKVGPYDRNRIAHIDNTGLVSSWNPNADGDVYTLLLYNGKLYAGGSFLTIGSQTRGFLAELNVATGMASSWEPDVNNAVYALAASGNTLFVGGAFSHAGGQSRNNIAAVSLTTGAANNWNPNANNVISVLMISDTIVYAGGYFTSVGGQSRNYLAALGLSGGKATGWNPAPNNAVNAMALSGNNLYVGGKFIQIGFKNRKFLACVDKTSGSVSTWSPDPDNVVNCLSVLGNSIYVGGDFSEISHFPQEFIAELDLTTGGVIAWDPNPNGTVNCICPTFNGIFVGGDFQIIGGKTRNYLACFLLDNQDKLVISPWNPNANGPVHTMVADTSVVFVGGDFTTLNNNPRAYLASLGKKSIGNVSPFWSPVVNAPVRSLAIKDYMLYAGGDFDSIDDTKRVRLAAIHKDAGILMNWNLYINGTVRALAVSDSFVYVGGDFGVVGDSSRWGVAAIERSAPAKVTSWNPSVGVWETVYALSILNDSLIYAGGSFTTVSGKDRKGLAAINRHTGQTVYTPNTNNTVYTLSISGNNLFVGGEYTIIGEVRRNSLAAFQASTGAILDWDPLLRQIPSNGDPEVPPKVYCITADSSVIYIGGVFTWVGPEMYTNIAKVDKVNGAAKSWFASCDGIIKSIVLADSTVYVGGDFSYVGTQVSYKIGALNKYTGFSYNWNLYADGNVNSIAVKDSLVYLGGDFSFIGGVFRNRLAAVSRKTGLSTTWNPDVGGLRVNSIVVTDTLLYAGGDFDYIGANARDNMAAVSLYTGKAKNWVYNTGGVVNDLFLKDSILYLGGDFVTVNSNYRNKLAAIDLPSGNLKGWNPNASNGVNKLAGYGSDKIILGGTFNTVLTIPVYSLAEVDTGSVTCNLVAKVTSVGSTPMCEGDTLILKANNDVYSYQWFRNDSLITGASDSNLYVVASGNYRVIIKDSLGCADTSSYTHITVYPKPAQNPITGDDSVYSTYAYSYKITKHSGSTYQWLVNGGTIISGSGTDSIVVLWSGEPGAGWIKMTETNANSCKGDTERLDVVKDSAYLHIQPQHLDYTVTGDSKQVTINSNLNWTAITDAPSWVSLSKTTGTGNDAIDVTVSSNALHTSRIATITFSANSLTRQVTIHQDSVPDIEELSLNKDSVFAPFIANTVMVKLHSNTSWNVTNNASWVEVNPMSGLGDTTLEINISANTTSVIRKTDLKVATSKLTTFLHIEQAVNVGIMNLDEENAFQLYPNPSNGKITLHNQTHADTDVLIYDVNGKQLDTIDLPAGETKELDYSGFKPGIYLAQIHSGDHTKHLKFIIMK